MADLPVEAPEAPKRGRPKARELPRFLPWPAGKPDRAPAWWTRYLMHYAKHGGVELAAHYARVHRVTVWEARQVSQEFDSACQAALAFYRDSLQWHLVDQALTTRNPLGLFGRLKAELPHLYVEKQLTMSLEAHTTVTAEEAQELLATVLTHVTPATREMLGLPAPSSDA